jgi:hypothetical protein
MAEAHYPFFGEIQMLKALPFQLLLLICLSAPLALAQDFAPPGNLVGIGKVHQNISVALNLKGADEFRVDPQKVKVLLREALNTAGIGLNGSGSGTPMISATISGESTGGDGARYEVEVFVRATVLSPFAKDRSVEVIFWRGVASAEELQRYDPASKGFVKPSGPINERVYASVRQVVGRLAADFKKANGR